MLRPCHLYLTTCLNEILSSSPATKEAPYGCSRASVNLCVTRHWTPEHHRKRAWAPGGTHPPRQSCPGPPRIGILVHIHNTLPSRPATEDVSLSMSHSVIVFLYERASAFNFSINQHVRKSHAVSSLDGSHGQVGRLGGSEMLIVHYSKDGFPFQTFSQPPYSPKSPKQKSHINGSRTRLLF